MEMGMFVWIGGLWGLEDLDFGCEIDFDLEEDDLEDLFLEGFDDFDDLDFILIYSYILIFNICDIVLSIFIGNVFWFWFIYMIVNMFVFRYIINVNRFGWSKKKVMFLIR